ncbi:hypothetical protein D0T57_06930 [Dysgonomonas sp. 511]|nr:hypothetical protein [Dysgonomonas sp. 511]
MYLLPYICILQLAGKLKKPSSSAEVQITEIAFSGNAKDPFLKLGGYNYKLNKNFLTFVDV